jgi:16S rRNA G527 N7-methylase RsmG
MANPNSTEPPLFSTESIIVKYDLSDRLESYLQEIFLYNDKINIVSRETDAGELRRIAVDSLAPFEFLPPPTGKIFDIGPGGGLPSIVVLLAFPNLEGLLIERTKKKTVFLKKIIDQFNLKAEILDMDFIEAKRRLAPSSFDLGLMKLVRPDSKLLQAAFDILKPNGFFIYYSDLDQTTVKIPAHIEIIKHKYFLDNSKLLRTITILKKLS